MKTILLWLKEHRTIATLLAMIITFVILILVFLITSWITGLVKHPNYAYLIFFGFWACFWCILAINGNHWFQKWLLKK